MNDSKSKKHIERAAELLFQIAKQSKQDLPSPEEEARTFHRNRDLIKNSKEMNRIFDENAKAILQKIKKR